MSSITLKNVAAVLLVCAALPTQAEIEKTAVSEDTGMHFYWWPKLSPLLGWHQDVEVSRHFGANMLVPDGKTFRDAETVIYARAIFKPRATDARTLADFIGNDRGRFVKAIPDIAVTEGKPLVTADGKRVITLEFSPKSKGDWERVAYMEEGDFYVIFTESSHSKAGLESSVVSFDSLISGYREAP